MSLLTDRMKAQSKLDNAVKALLELSDWDNKYHSHPYKRLLQSGVYINLCKYRAKKAHQQLKIIDCKLNKIKDNAISPELELLARLMIIFKPELKNEIEAIITFT